MYKLIATINFLLLFTYSIAQTNVIGPYFTNQVWTVTGSPYNVIGNVQIPSGVTLTINPGVTINYSGAFKILIKGTLIANGTQTDSITFKSNTSGVSTGSTLVEFSDVFLTNQQMNFVKMQDATNSLVTSGTCTGALSLTNFFINSAAISLGVANTKFKLINSSIFNSPIITTTEQIKLELLNTFLLNGNLGITKSFSNSNIDSLIVTNSTLQNTSLTQQGFGSSSINFLQFNTCNILNLNYTFFNRGGKLEFNDCNLTNANLTYTQNRLHVLLFKNCVVDNYTSSAMELQGYNSSDSLKIINSKFKNSNLDFRDFFGNAIFYSTKSIYTNTTITNNTSNGSRIDSCIFVCKSNNTISLRNSIIRKSIFIGQGIGNNVNDIRGTLNNVSFVDNAVASIVTGASNFNGCNIFRNDSLNISNTSSSNIIATQNYWSVFDSVSIKNKIYDYYNDITKGKVIIGNFLNTPNNNCPVVPPLNLIKQNVSGGVQFSWNSNPETDILGYKLYYGNFDGFNFSNSINVGNVNTYTLASANAADTFAITAYDNIADGINDIIEGHESWYSKEAACIPPSTYISANGSTTFCQGGSVILNADTGTTLTYQWKNDGVDILGAISSSYSATVSGNYNAVINSSSGCSAISTPIYVQVNPLPTVSSITGSNDTAICSGSSITLYGNVGGIWSTNDTLNSITVSTNGNYFITNTNSCGSINSDTITVTIIPLPTASVISSAGGVTSFCVGSSLQLIGNNGGVWSDNSTNPTLLVYQSGSYFVTNQNSCGTLISNTIIVTSHPLPTATISVSGSDLLTPNIFSSYQWLQNGNNIAGANSFQFTPTANGNYSVLVTDSFGCSDTSAVLNWTLTTLHDLNLSNNISIFPNPTSSEFTITTNKIANNIEVYNSMGQIIYEEKPITKSTTIILNNFAKGIYFIKCYSSLGTEIKKLIIN